MENGVYNVCKAVVQPTGNWGGSRDCNSNQVSAKDNYENWHYYAFWFPGCVNTINNRISRLQAQDSDDELRKEYLLPFEGQVSSQAISCFPVPR